MPDVRMNIEDIYAIVGDVKDDARYVAYLFADSLVGLGCFTEDDLWQWVCASEHEWMMWFDYDFMETSHYEILEQLLEIVKAYNSEYNSILDIDEVDRNKFIVKTNKGQKYQIVLFDILEE